MVVVTTDYVSGKELETIQLVSGSSIQTRHIGKDIGASLKTLVGGELKNYIEMMNSARDLAIHRMISQAESFNADGIVNVRFVSAEIAQGAAEVLAYGTAVRFKES